MKKMMIKKKIEGEREMQERIVIESVPNRAIKRFHVTTEISTLPEQTFFRPIRSTSKKYLRTIGLVGAEIVTECLSISGVNSVSIKPYSIWIEKALAFEWDDGLEVQVIDVLRKKAFGPDAGEIEVAHVCTPYS